MAGFVVFKRLTQEAAEDFIQQLTKWFEDNPTRRVCYTDLFKVRKSHLREDVMKHAEQPST